MQFHKQFLFVSSLLITLAGCGGSSSTSTTGTTPGTGGDEVPAVVLELVQALFPTNGAKWNDYLVGSDFNSATDDACIAGTSPDCLHGGEARVVEATGKTSCTGLSASDELEAFDWVCDDSSGSARFISTGLADGKFLSDLVDFSALGFKTNSVTVYENGTAWASTPGSSWWSNSFEAAVPGALVNASTIYLRDTPSIDAFILAAAKVSLVVAPGVSISGPGTGAFAVADADGIDYLWFEGSVDATGDTNAISLANARHSTLRNVSAKNGSGIGVWLYNASNSRLSSVNASLNGSTGVFLSNNSVYNWLSNIQANNNNQGVVLSDAAKNSLLDITANNNSTYGVSLLTVGTNNNRLERVTANSNGSNGVYLNLDTNNNRLSGMTTSNNGTFGVSLAGGANNNSFSGVTSSNNDSLGVYLLASSNNNRLAGITTSSNGNAGLNINNSRSNTVSGLTSNNNPTGANVVANSSNNTLSGLIFSNNSNGLAPTSTSNLVISDIASTGHSNAGILISNVTNVRFTGLLKVGNNATDCFVSGTNSNPGIDSSCANDIDSGSDTTLTPDILLANSFIGKVITEDTANDSDLNGEIDFATVNASFDWSNFDNAYRHWGMDGVAFADSSHKGRWTTGNGRIWDWSLATADTVLRDVLSLPDGNLTLTHNWDIGAATPTDDTACNLIVAGSVHNTGACETTYLQHAAEIPGDDIGNDNTLCESGETCLYAPNIGSYQGHGELISAGTFTPAGGLTGITLMRFADNGR
jgi:nitrous oxidase accessory protein NosD